MSDLHQQQHIAQQWHEPEKQSRMRAPQTVMGMPHVLRFTAYQHRALHIPKDFDREVDHTGRPRSDLAQTRRRASLRNCADDPLPGQGSGNLDAPTASAAPRLRSSGRSRAGAIPRTRVRTEGHGESRVKLLI